MNKREKEKVEVVLVLVLVKKKSGRLDSQRRKKWGEGGRNKKIPTRGSKMRRKGEGERR